MSGTIFTVSTALEANEAIAQARGGDTILLAPGHYDTLSASRYGGFGYIAPGDGQVTIRSADPTNPASIGGLALREAGGLVFEQLHFKYQYSDGDPSNIRPFLIRDSRDITFRDSIFEGSLVDEYGHGFGLSFRSSSSILVENNEFFNWTRGLLFNSTESISVLGNEVHSIRSDGMNFAQVQNVLIENNHIHSFRGDPTSGDHRDMIQFWTAGTSAPSTDIVIRNNLLDIGEGSRTQSIFMRNELVDSRGAGSEMYYKNILIEGNIIYNAHSHGITVGETDGLVIRQNSVLRHEGELHGASGAATAPVIRVAEDSSEVVIEKNVVARIVGGSDQASWSRSGNVLVQDDNLQLPGYFGNNFLSSTFDHIDGALKYIVLPGSEIEAIGAGSPRLLLDRSPLEISAAFQVAGAPDSSRTLVFDAGFTLGPTGHVQSEDARFIWHFGDGTSAEGRILRHSFERPGLYDVVLEVIGADGSSSIAQHRVSIAGERIASLDPDRGGFVLHAFGEETFVAINRELLVETDAGMAFQLGGTGVQASVSSNSVSRLFGSQGFELSFTLQSDGGSGELARISSFLTATVREDGNFQWEFRPDDGSRVSLQTEGRTLNDGSIHEVTVRFLGNDGRLEILIGDELVAGKDIAGSVQSSGRSLDFGPSGSSSRKGFDGLLLDFDLRSIKPDYPLYEGDAAAVIASRDSPVAMTLPDAIEASPDPIATEWDDAQPIAPEGWQMPFLDGYVLDPIAEAGELHFIGDAHVVFGEAGYSIRYDGDGDAVRLGRLKEFEASQRLGFSVEYTHDANSDGMGRLVWNHKKLGLSVGEDRLNIAIGTADEGLKWFRIEDAGLLSGAANRVTVFVDAEADRVQVIVNDRLVFEETETDLEFVGAGGHEWGWSLGTHFGHFFAGEVHDFRISDRFEFLETSRFQEDAMLLG